MKMLFKVTSFNTVKLADSEKEVAALDCKKRPYLVAFHQNFFKKIVVSVANL